GIIPASAAAAIVAAADVKQLDAQALAGDAAAAGNLAIPLVRQLTRLVEARDRDAARWVHWGATSQDIIDTALVLQLRDTLPLVTRQIVRAAAAAARHARDHARTP